jgi:hypothetical protein
VHLSVHGATKSVCRGLAEYPVVDAVVCVVNCCQDSNNKKHHVTKAAIGCAISTVVCVRASSLTGPFAPFVLR